MLVSGFSLLLGRKEKPDRAASDRNIGPGIKPFAGAGIAIFLLVFIAAEALTAVHAFRYQSPFAALTPRSPATLSGLVAIPTAMPEERNVHGNLGRPGQATEPANRDWSESRTGGRVKGPARSASSVSPPAN
jgi:hypothetical protein